MAVTEQQLETWAKAISETESIKCQAAVDRITKALNTKFGTKIRIFLQGSYKNTTNVRLDSDVDIVVCYTNVYYHDTVFLTDEEIKTFNSLRSLSSYTFSQFKNEVETALVDEFGRSEVERKDRCINVKGNTYRVVADVVPSFIHKRLKSGYPSDSHTVGIEFRTETGDKVISFPEQHYDNGIQKHADTNKMYKPIVRILKRIRNQLVDDGKITLKDMPSFSLECLVWNVLPHTHFHKSTYKDAVNSVISQIYNDVRDEEKSKAYNEVSGLMKFFPPPSKVTPKQVEDFIVLVWTYLN